MAFESLLTIRLNLPYFGDAYRYSGEADRQRFLYLDYNLESYVGVIGVGLISGWTITDAGGLNITIGAGTAILRDFFSESPFTVKERSTVLPGDTVVSLGYYVDIVEPAEDDNDYDADLGQFPPSVSDTTTYYDKILYSSPLTMADDSDNYVYIYRNSNESQDDPYHEPDNSLPIIETASNENPIHTAVAFGITSSKKLAQTSGREFIGKIVTRSGDITEIDVSDVTTLQGLAGPILAFGESAVNTHNHGGSGTYDPEAIHLRTDLRKTFLQSVNDAEAVYRIMYSDPTSITNGHKHRFMVDSSGNGFTVDNIGGTDTHYHEILEYAVLSAVLGDDLVDDHGHTLPVTATSTDPWVTAGDFVININDIPYTGSNATVDPSEKTITFTEDVTVTKRKYSINKTFDDGSTYDFESNENGVFRFLLRASLDYYSKNADEIHTDTKTPLIFPDPTTPVSTLADQSVVAEQRLVAAGDTFKFTGVVAPDPVTVILVEPGSIDEVTIEITSNSEVTGKLKAQNVLYLPAEKFVTGTFDIGRIPILSHVGRLLEECKFAAERGISQDGYTYTVDNVLPWGNSKVVYSSHVQTNGDTILGTSDGLYFYPASGSYLFVVNGEKIHRAYGDLKMMLVSAVNDYNAKTGSTMVVKDATFDPQITSAENALTKVGTYYRLNGDYQVIDDNVVYDIVDVFYIDGYKVPTFGDEEKRLQSEILDVEEIVSVDPDDATKFLVKNDFNKSVINQIIVESDITDTYGGLNQVFFTFASDFFTKSIDIDKNWGLIYQSGTMGYIKGVERTFEGFYVVYSTNGLYICKSTTASEYREAELPSFYSDVIAMSFGFDDLLLISYKGGDSYTTDYGTTWTDMTISNNDIEKFMFDPTNDTTSTVSSHYHGMDINFKGTGATSGMFDASDAPISETHTHTVTVGSLSTDSGHTHIGEREFYAVDTKGSIYKSSDLTTWVKFADTPTVFGQVGISFVGFGKLFFSTAEGIVSTVNGTTWTKLVGFDSLIHSSQWSDDKETMYLGGVNEFYSYDGTTVTKVKTLEGNNPVSVHVDDSKKIFGFTFTNKSNKVDFKNDDKTNSTVDLYYDFSSCNAVGGAWTAGVPYDLYVNERLIQSTRESLTLVGSNKVTVSNLGQIDFNATSPLAAEIEYGASYIDVDDGDNFPSSGIVRVSWSSSLSFFLKFSSKTDNRLFLTGPSINSITPSDSLIVTVDLVGSIGDDDDVLITIYEGRLTNVGENTHEEIENDLSTKNIGSSKSFSDVFLSNVAHLTVAIRAAISGVGDDYKNYFLSLFDYNDTPGDPDNIDRFIDRVSSDFYSQVIYSNAFTPNVALTINRIVFGFGSFPNTMLIATNIGLFASKTNLGLEANWFRINVSSSEVAYDVLQTRTGEVFVCTELGMYQNDNVDLDSWTLLEEEKLGGIPTKIVPRWGTINAYNNDSQYWWQGWTGVSHSNQDLINSLIISGVGFMSVSDDYGLTWQKGILLDASGSVVDSNFTTTDTEILHSGSILFGLRDVTNDASKVMYSTGNGSVSRERLGLSKYTATVSEYSITSDSNVNLSVAYSGDIPPTGRLRGLNLSVNANNFDVIDNSTGSLLVFGTSIIDSLLGDDLISVSPPVFNSISEFPEGQVAFGTSNGVLTDRGVLLSADESSSGLVKKVGNRGVVSSLNINGELKSVVFSTGTKALLSLELNMIVKQNEIQGQLIKIEGFTDMTVSSNESTSVNNLTSVLVEHSIEAIPTGVPITVVGESNRLYVTFDSLVRDGDVTNGKLYIKPADTSSTPAKSILHEFSIVGNGEGYVDIVQSDELELVWENEFYSGLVIFCTQPDDTVPLFVEFSKKPLPGSLKGSAIKFREISENIDSVEFKIVDNTEIAVYVQDSAQALFTSISGSSLSDSFLTYSLVFDGGDFTIETVGFESDEKFNSRSTSKETDHFHTTNLYGKEIDGKIDTFGDTTSTYVDLNVTSAGIGEEPFLSDSTLLGDQKLVAYDPDNYSRVFDLVIVSTTASKIRVLRDGDVFNVSGDDVKKISPDYKFFIDASRYGSTAGTEYSKDFITKTGHLTASAFIDGTTFTIDDTTSLSVGERVVIFNVDGIEFKSEIATIPTSATFTTNDATPFDFTLNKDSGYRILFTKLTISEYDLTADLDLGDTDVTISSTSDLSIGDIVTLSDDKGLFMTSTVKSIVGPTVFRLNNDSNADFTTSDSAKVTINRNNFTDSHSHTIKSGEFSSVDNSTWHKRGYQYKHGHIISPFVKEVSDIEVIDGRIYVVGSGSKIYISDDNGNEWSEFVDLANFVEFSPTPGAIQRIRSDGNNIIFGTDSGYMAYFSVSIPTAVVPLEFPVG